MEIKCEGIKKEESEVGKDNVSYELKEGEEVGMMWHDVALPMF